MSFNELGDSLPWSGKANKKGNKKKDFKSKVEEEVRLSPDNTEERQQGKKGLDRWFYWTCIDEQPDEGIEDIKIEVENELLDDEKLKIEVKKEDDKQPEQEDRVGQKEHVEKQPEEDKSIMKLVILFKHYLDLMIVPILNNLIKLLFCDEILIL